MLVQATRGQPQRAVVEKYKRNGHPDGRKAWVEEERMYREGARSMNNPCIYSNLKRSAWYPMRFSGRNIKFVFVQLDDIWTEFDTAMKTSLKRRESLLYS